MRPMVGILGGRNARLGTPCIRPTGKSLGAQLVGETCIYTMFYTLQLVQARASPLIPTYYPKCGADQSDTLIQHSYI